MFEIDKLSHNEKKAIEELESRVKNILTQSMLEDTSLFYRFMKARDFDVNAAEVMIQKHLSWRKLYQIDTILEDFTPREFFFKYVQSSILGFDKEGSMVLYNPSGKLDAREILRCVKMTKYIKYWAWYIEKVLKYLNEQNKISGRNPTPMTFIINMDKLTLGNVMHKKTAEVYLSLTDMLQNNYPEYMKVSYLINAPTYVTTLYTLLKAIMSNAMIKKIHIFGQDCWKEKLLEAIDADVLPAFLGGNRTDPDGDPLCKTFVNHGGRISPEYFLTEEERYFKNRPGVEKVTIPKMNKKEIVVDVEELGSVIRWEFYTKSNINFGLYRGLPDKPQEEVIPLLRYDTSDGAEKDSYKVRIPGKYIIVFDNSYSWITSKDVEYCIQIIRPDQ